MRIISDISIANFDAWSGAKDTLEQIIDNNKVREFDNLIDELYPEGLTDTQLNDILWHDSDWVLDSLGIEETDNEEEN